MESWPQLQSQVIDAHCHLWQYADREALLAALDRDRSEIIVVTLTPAEYVDVASWVGARPRIHCALGLFPTEISEPARQLAEWRQLRSETRFIGEVGLDYVCEDDAQRARQRLVFEAMLADCADAGDKVISVHSRRAGPEALAMIGGNFPGSVIMHWYSGPPGSIRDTGSRLWFSVNTAMVRSRRGRELVRQMRPEQVLTETDGPYVLVDGRPAVPHDLHLVFSALGELWGCTLAAALAQVRENFDRVLRPVSGADD